MEQAGWNASSGGDDLGLDGTAVRERRQGGAGLELWIVPSSHFAHPLQARGAL
jgi:hypothetical protein